ncbi:MAG: GntR family transcriptional regulator [Desulfobacteraceae bacterium]|nr:GntR family transcriptional regulator [Desulfobacteraceae bacterium]
MEINSLKDKVYKSLRRDIISGKLAGGTRITESAVAISLGVSRTPVREAMQKLLQERILKSIHRAGYLVEDLSDDEIRDLFDIRMEIESIAIKKAINQISVDELKQLDDNLEATKGLIKNRETEYITHLDIEFHSTIYKAARSKTLYRICKNLSDLTMKYRTWLHQDKTLWNEALQHHLLVYQTLLSKDEKGAMKAVSSHLNKAKSHILEMMKRMRSDAFAEEDL